jgi:tRNA-2-methylthio-N6-dimethylallyladenosine synthase
MIFAAKIPSLKNMTTLKKKFHLIIFGCQMNLSDAERLSSALEKLGYQKTDNEDEADLIGIIACSVRQSAVDRIVGKLRNWQIVKEKRPLITLLSGCVLEHDQKKLANKFDIFLDIKNLTNLAADLKKAAPEQKLALPEFFDIQPSYYSKHRAYIPIMTGCNKFCTYCAVPYTRGRETSRPSQQIITEVENLLKQGYKEIILLGQNVNSYGLDRQEITFPELLKKIDSLGDHFWLKFLTSHPYDMSDDLITVMKQGKNISPYLHLPVQSGADSMLKKMNRHYSIADYKKLIKKINQALPNMAISTDVIVGFSEETETEFLATKKLLADSKFNMAYMSQYSRRIGTKAAELYSDDIDKKIKKQRWDILNKVMAKNSLTFNQDLVGQKLEVLIDAVNKTSTGYKNVGKLNNYVTVYIHTDQPMIIGEFAKVKITKANPWRITGELIK